MARQKYVPKTYPDTAAGAIQMLADDSTYDVSHATAYADPSVEGVWMVQNVRDPDTNGRVKVVVYLAGYKDPMGRLREFNDFEETM